MTASGRREAEILRFVLDQQTVWHDHFPTLHSRTHELIVGYLCTKARRGTTARQLYGATKEHFQLDDSTVRERIANVQRLDYVIADPPDDRLTGRSILTPSAALSRQFSTYTLALAVRMCTAAGAMTTDRSYTPPSGLTDQQEAAVYDTLERYTDAWIAAAERFLETTPLSPSRRMEARRRLMTTSYWTLLHRAIEERFSAWNGAASDGLFADQLAVAVLTLNGQGVHTTREHIAALIELGLFERRRDRVLRIALAEQAARQFQAAMAQFAETLLETADLLDTDGTAADRTLRFATPPEGTAGPEEQPRYCLAILEPADAARRIPLSARPLSVGRTNASDLVLADALVSRDHCELRLEGGVLIVTDRGSTNGTFVNGHRIDAPTKVECQGHLKIGPFAIAFDRADNTAD